MRSSGILCHVTSLPGAYGLGDLGSEAVWFLDLLQEMRQRWWQVLPLGPTGYGNSPYQSSSTFAGNPALISLGDLADRGLLPEMPPAPPFPRDRVDFAWVLPWRMGALEQACNSLVERGSREERGRFAAFVDRHDTTWLDDFAVFTALKRAHRHGPWWEWPADLAHREPRALAAVRRRMATQIRAVKVEQYLFEEQFRLLRGKCGERRVGLIGDLPIFVAHDSADVWANRDLFQLDEDLSPQVVAGVPPDYFSLTGQRWGNPLYDWDRHRADGYAWWKERLRRAFSMFDLVRIDHFRGFAGYWEIPAAEPTAVKGRWVPGPGHDLFEVLRTEFGDLPVIAEDLGVVTKDVEELRDGYGFPGMKVLAFGFGAESAHALESFRRNVVAYTGTHDNDTARGWWKDPKRAREHRVARRLLGTDGREFHWDLISALLHSIADTTIVPLQDLLGLGSEARMNIPGTDSGNWEWRLQPEMLTDGIVERMRTLTVATGRG